MSQTPRFWLENDRFSFGFRLLFKEHSLLVRSDQCMESNRYAMSEQERDHLHDDGKVLWRSTPTTTDRMSDGNGGGFRFDLFTI